MPGSAMPGATRLFLAGNGVAMTGNGLVIAFTLIYLHQTRGIALPVVGLLLAAAAAAGLRPFGIVGHISRAGDASNTSAAITAASLL